MFFFIFGIKFKEYHQNTDKHELRAEELQNEEHMRRSSNSIIEIAHVNWR